MGRIRGDSSGPWPLPRAAGSGLLPGMSNDRPRFNIWLNVFILGGIVVVAVVQAQGYLPEDNVVVTGIAYFAGGAAGALLYAGLSDLRQRFFGK